jgi:outer membrane receptor for ferrienterochelin and colicins
VTPVVYRPALGALLIAFAARAALGQTAGAPRALSAAAERPAVTRIEDLALEDLLNPAVWVATKSALHVAQTPAVVTVITADEIQARGYTSLADVLRSVPGFYDVYDGVTHNVGIRGVNGGQNASGSGLKLMIDGQAVGYGPSSGNFFGEELIPIQVVERVEIIRGPASALYGADAFLGAINVITRSGESTQGVQLIGHGALARGHPGGGGGLVMGGRSGNIDVLLAADYLYLDRSGVALPGSSPLLSTGGATPGALSQGDTAAPASVLGKLSLSNVLQGTVTLMGTIQRLDSHGAFQSFGPLDPSTRLTALNQSYRLSYDVSAGDGLHLTLSASHFSSNPTSDSALGLGRTDYLMIPSLAAWGEGLNGEIHFSPHPMLALTAGTDLAFEDSVTETYDQKLLMPVMAGDGSVLRAAGTIIPGEQHGVETEFSNVGAFLQAMVTPSDEWTAIAGVRLDEHNIYGAHLSARAGVVYALRALSLKLLYGSSFKAPSAEQLYAHPVAFGGVLGNPTLRAQTAHSAEAALGIRLPGDLGDVQVNGYVTKVLGRVEFLPTGSYVIANNTQDEWLAGGELVSRFVPTHRLRGSLLASVARTVQRSGVIQGLLGRPVVTNPLFPSYEVGTIVEYGIPRLGMHLSVDLAYVGRRSASFSNALLRGSAYDLDGYLSSALSLSAGGHWLFSDRESRIALRVSDVLDQRWAEPGFGGVDVPTMGTTAFVTVTQGF